MRASWAVIFALTAWPLAAAEDSLIRIDPYLSQATFKVNLRVPIPAEGRFQSVNGEVRQLPDFRQSVHVILDARELNMSGPPWVQRVTQSTQFLNSAKFPIIDFQSNPFSSQLLLSGGEIKGMLSIRGLAKEVVFTINPSLCRQPGVTCPIVANGRLNRHDFEMSAYRWGLHDEVQFAFQLKFLNE
jgi:polyisoprenoid-binding protein YceI